MIKEIISDDNKGTKVQKMKLLIFPNKRFYKSLFDLTCLCNQEKELSGF